VEPRYLSFYLSARGVFSDGKRIAAPPEAKHGAFPRRKKNNAARRKAKLLASMAKVRGDFSRPLSSLASKEAELDERSAALANFP
jgi:hypothetical protein